jgi:hypothetical protein
VEGRVCHKSIREVVVMDENDRGDDMTPCFFFQSYGERTDSSVVGIARFRLQSP